MQAWALEQDLDPSKLSSNSFAMEWPPHSGRFGDFPKIDRAHWFPIGEARDKILGGQREFLQRLVRRTGKGARTSRGSSGRGSDES